MSKAARELAAWFVKHYGLESEEEGDDGTCTSCIAEVDQAVAPLVDLAESAIAYINESPCDPDIHPEQWAAWQRYQKALEAQALKQWRE